MALLEDKKSDNYQSMVKTVCLNFEKYKDESDFFKVLEKVFQGIDEIEEFAYLELSFNGQKLLSPLSHLSKFRAIPSLWLGQACAGSMISTSCSAPMFSSLGCWSTCRPIFSKSSTLTTRWVIDMRCCVRTGSRPSSFHARPKRREGICGVRMWSLQGGRRRPGTSMKSRAGRAPSLFRMSRNPASSPAIIAT